MSTNAISIEEEKNLAINERSKKPKKKLREENCKTL
jgi:hypothetical protein